MSRSYPFTDISVGLRDVRIEIPTAVKKGDNAVLICNYDMEGESLYSIKWYKGRREFYRYLPSEHPQPIKTFSLPGINVEVKRNDVKKEVRKCNFSLFLYRRRCRMPRRLCYPKSTRTFRESSHVKVI